MHAETRRITSHIYRVTEQEKPSRMSQVLRLLLLAIIGASTCMALSPLTTMPQENARRMRRGPQDNWPGVYPATIRTIGGVYADRHDGVFNYDGEVYNERPVYKSGGWSIYYRTSGYAANQWVLDFNDVSEDWDGTVAIQPELFASTV